ncbi:MAG: TonB family protein [Candidatus Acidiferrales bacterium]
MRAVLGICITFALAKCARAQLPDMQPLADQMAQEITASKQASVVVLDFFGPDQGFNKLGQSLADNFNDDLKNSKPAFAIRERQQMPAWLKAKGYPLNAFKSVDLALWVAGQLNIDSAVVGNISVLESEITVEVNLYRVDTRQLIKRFEISSLVSDETRSMANSPSTSAPTTIDSTIPISGQNGFTQPVCISCPGPAYDEQARAHRTQGAVVLMAVIASDGSVQTLSIEDALPDGLTENALEAVRKWKFQPALGPDGKPAKVQHSIRIRFNGRRTLPQYAGPVYAGGSGAYTHAVCIRCPQPQFPEGARNGGVQGKVELALWIGVDGKVFNVIVKKALSAELTENAVAAVKDWTFKPGKGPGGKPANVQEIVEITYHLH